MDTLRGANNDIKRCNTENLSGIVTVRFVVQPTGDVAEVEVKAPHANNALGVCVQEVVSGLVFPAFSGSPMTITFPFRLR